MPANEFEKQVQKQMEEFRLEPSASVWENVEKEIREKKRRRIIFYFLLPLAAGLIGFSLYQFLIPDKKTEAIPQPVSVKEKSLPGTTNNKNTTPEKSDPVTVSETTTVTDQNDPSPSQAGKAERIMADRTTDDATPVKKRPGNISKPAPAQNNIAKPKKKNSLHDNSLAIDIAAPSKQKITKEEDQPVQDKTGISEEIAVIQPETKPAELKTTASDTEGKVVAKDTVITTDVVAENDKKETGSAQKKSSGKLKWGLDLAAGLAYNNKGTLTFARAEAFDLNNAAPGNTAGNGGPISVIPPSPVRQGPAFRLGVVAEMQVSERSRFSAALQYAYVSNRISVGSPVDTAVRLQSYSNSLADVSVEKLYQGAQTNDYTNRYHFVRLPLMYHWQVTSIRKLPVELNAGLGASYLFTTNALVYSGSLGGIYYEDKNAFNKLHWDLGTGLSFRLKTKNNSEWVIGPQLSFDMTRLVKGDNKQYLMFGGIHARWLFSKKKQ